MTRPSFRRRIRGQRTRCLRSQTYSRQCEALEDRRLLALTVSNPIPIVASDHAGALSVKFADLDGDNDVDILSASGLDGRIGWYENTDGQGTFGEQRLVDERAGSIEMVEVGDFNGDGLQDIAAIDADLNEAIWFANLGGGQFAASQQISPFVFDGGSIHAADIDGDDDLDLVTTSSNYYDSDVAWYENLDGQGNFGAQSVVTSEISIPLDAVTADIDGDGRLDIVSASYFDSTLQWFRNTDGLGSFGPGNVIDMPAAASEVAVGDIDGDGDIDVVVGTSEYPDPGSIHWYANDGTGAFSGANTIDGGGRDGVTSVQLIDVDGDGDLDVAASSLYDGLAGWYENTDSLGGFGPLKAFTTGTGDISSIDLADVNGDGAIDVGFSSFVDDVIGWIPNQDNTFTTPEILTRFGVVGVDSVVAADFDNDGDLDIASASVLDNSITWLENLDGQGSFSDKKVVDSEFTGAIYLEAHDLNGDDLPDLLASAASLNSVAWWANLGDGTFSGRRTITTNAPLTEATTAFDIDGDGDLDVVAAGTDYYNRSVAWFENDGNGEFGLANNIAIQLNSPREMEGVDMDNDGDNDLVVQSLFDNSVVWYENTDSKGTFGTENIISVSARIPTAVEVGDLDGDGDIDVAVAAFYANQIAWFENDGTSLSFTAEFFDVPAGPESLELADIDGDGDLDMFATSLVADQLSWFENLGGGQFAAAVILDASLPGASSVTVGDIDGDLDLDVIAAAYDNSRVNWYANETPMQGDFDESGAVDAADIDALCAAIQDGSDPVLFDLNGDGSVDMIDHHQMIDSILNTTLGDANLDGVFNSSDLVQVFTFGEYEDTLEGNSGWASGDWNCDGDFNTSDLVAAFTSGGYADANAARPSSSVTMGDIAASLAAEDLEDANERATRTRHESA